ncbi:hypothetical protein J6590_062378 [Homalodisca vitripennis]|nr:hypothetical protein J6590_062378 [Homalodisca vitripennis]
MFVVPWAARARGNRCTTSSREETRARERCGTGRKSARVRHGPGVGEGRTHSTTRTAFLIYLRGAQKEKSGYTPRSVQRPTDTDHEKAINGSQHLEQFRQEPQKLILKWV